MTYRFDLNQRLSRRTALALPPTLIAAGKIGSSRAAPIEPTTGDEATADGPRYFAKTGHNLKSPYVEAWTRAGGEETLGVPISEERYDPDLGLVQTFEGITLVYDPSLQAPWDVQGQHLPREVLTQVAPSSARRKVKGCSSSSSCQFFPDSGHTISGRIARFWSNNGD
ncbi:MAG: hypothetical protein QOF33_1194, partial [Thermomicrobiales bacterium]|nr:hypothetical protein [Thermomicrobiales bacterium]